MHQQPPATDPKTKTRAWHRWTERDKDIIREAIKDGRTTQQVLHLFPGRTAVQIQNYFNIIRREMRGLCSKCGQSPAPVDSNYSYCPECREKMRRNMVEARSKGICTSCRKRPADRSLTFCSVCYERRLKYAPPKAERKPMSIAGHRGMIRWLGCGSPAAIFRIVPPGITRFVDLFGGSASFTLEARRQSLDVVYNEVHPHLVDLVRTTKEGRFPHVLSVAKALVDYCSPDELQSEYEKASTYPDPVVRAALLYVTANSVEGHDMRRRQVRHIRPIAPHIARRAKDWHRLLASVEIRQGDFKECVDLDDPSTLFYADPPWPAGPKKFEYMLNGRHQELGEMLRGLKGHYVWVMGSTRQSMAAMRDCRHIGWLRTRSEGGGRYRQILASSFPTDLHPVNPSDYGL
jgi:site-specific DNA-adenine methylase